MALKRRRRSRFRDKHVQRASRWRKGFVTATQIRAEGVLSTGRVHDTSVLYVQTMRGIRLFHAESLRVFMKAEARAEAVRAIVKGQAT